MDRDKAEHKCVCVAVHQDHHREGKCFVVFIDGSIQNIQHIILAEPQACWGQKMGVYMCVCDSVFLTLSETTTEMN